MADALSLTFSAPVELTAAPAAEAGQPAKRPTFNVVAYTGVAMNAGGFFYPVIVELSGVRSARKQIPALLDHDPSQIVGQGEPTVDSASIRFAGTITGEDAAAQKVIANAKNGFQWQASIGASVTRREFLEAGKKAVVNGREINGPAIIARESQLNEISFVAIGADQQTSAAVAANSPPAQGSARMSFEQWLTARNIDVSKLDEPTKKALEAAFNAEVKASAAPAPATAPATVPAPITATPNGQTFADLDALMASTARESERQKAIVELTAQFLPLYPDCREEIEAAARRASADPKISPNDFELAVTRATRGRAPAAIGRRGSAPDLPQQEVIECAVCVAAGLSNAEKVFGERTLEAAHRRFKGRIGLQEVLLMFARAAGCDSLSVRSGLESILRATFRQDLQASSGFSTIALPSALSNIANKFIIESYNFVEASWRDVFATSPVSDFKTITNHSLTGDLQYEKIGPGGEIPHGSLGELTFTNKADTYGKMLAVTRTDMINDDLSAFARVPRRLGRGGALAINDVVWTEFLSNSSFFTTGNLNYDDGTDTALDAAGLTKALGTFWPAQTDADGKPLGARAAVLLVPPAQEIPALALMNSTLYNSGGAASTALIPSSNPLAGRLKVVMSTYLANSSYTGYSAVAYYILCDRNDIPVLDVCFLDGREMPIVESAAADFDQLGMKFRAYHDFGAAKQDYRGGMKFKGEA